MWYYLDIGCQQCDPRGPTGCGIPLPHLPDVRSNFLIDPGLENQSRTYHQNVSRETTENRTHPQPTLPPSVHQTVTCSLHVPARCVASHQSSHIQTRVLHYGIPRHKNTRPLQDQHQFFVVPASPVRPSFILDRVAFTLEPNPDGHPPSPPSGSSCGGI